MDPIDLGCARKCRFRFCRADLAETRLGKGPSLFLSGPRAGVHPYICGADGSTVSDKVQTAQAKIQTDEGNFVKISKWTAASPAFKPRFFRTQRVKGLGKTGISFAGADGNQWSLIKDRCVYMRITKGEEDGEAIDKNDPTSCISFVMETAVLQIALFWPSSDDLDLEVLEPDNGVLTTGAPTGFGIIKSNVAKNACDRIKAGKEVALYPTSCTDGQYCARVRLTRRCSTGKIKFTIFAYLNGKKMASRQGAGTDDTILQTVCFRVPDGTCPVAPAPAA